MPPPRETGITAEQMRVWYETELSTWRRRAMTAELALMALTEQLDRIQAQDQPPETAGS